MVMEAPPSPQSVGREFVRQYYTLLNKAPTHLHRFYNHQSSFVHGGLDPPNRETSPVIGQKQIHQKIQQLNFRDCHAKITQVDSQATLGNGVVVQVTGELSNGGQPMRRFTQTFVLAAQSPKKYYVHNDIFRYQDEIVSEDEECDGDVRSDPEEEVQGGQVMMEAPLPINQPVVPPYYPNAGPIPANLPAVPIHHNQQPPPHVLNAPPQPLPAVNGAMHPEDIPIMQGPVPPHVPAPQLPGLGAPLPAMQAGLVPAPMPPVLVEESQQPPQLVMEEPAEEQLEVDYSAEEAELEAEEEVNNIETSPSSNSNEPKTYANLLKSGNAAPFASAQPAQAVLSPAAAQPAGSASPPQTASGGFQQVGGRSSTGRVAPRGGQQSRAGGRQEPRVGGSTRNEDSAYDERRRGQGAGFGDANQLFLGNLPHAASEDELREIFGEFGVIVDLRVHSKPANKVGGAPAGRAPPNFGFITFESQQGVQNCLQASPIFYPKDDKNGTLLNVEGKKTKPSYGGGRPSADNRGGAPRRGGTAASGPTRGGPPRPGGAYSNRGFNRR